MVALNDLPVVFVVSGTLAMLPEVSQAVGSVFSSKQTMGRDYARLFLPNFIRESSLLEAN